MEKNDVLICWQIWPNAFCENELVILLEKRLEKRPTQQGTSEEQASINAHCQSSKRIKHFLKNNKIEPRTILSSLSQDTTILLNFFLNYRIR